MTSVGFRQLGTEQYTEAIQKLKPDIAVGLADVGLGQKPGVKRRERMVERTHAWTRDATNQLYGSSDPHQMPTKTLFLAPLLPLDQPESSLYLADLENEMKDYISGFALYDASSITSVPESLSTLVRMSLGEPSTPQAILREVSLGIDITAVPFIGSVSEAGIALDFVFPRPVKSGLKPKSLGFDMWSPTHAVDMSPLVQDCQCYTCQKHHRAYIRHLLSAKEMLAWTLLQIHNYHTMDSFFAAIRASIANGTFTEDVETFERTYERDFPEQGGPGPRYVFFLQFCGSYPGPTL
jgi:queuine tRNA-ribosyltransferase